MWKIHINQMLWPKGTSQCLYSYQFTYQCVSHVGMLSFHHTISVYSSYCTRYTQNSGQWPSVGPWNVIVPKHRLDFHSIFDCSVYWHLYQDTSVFHRRISLSWFDSGSHYSSSVVSHSTIVFDSVVSDIFSVYSSLCKGTFHPCSLWTFVWFSWQSSKTHQLSYPCFSVTWSVSSPS